MFEAERKKASFNKRDLCEFIYGGKEELQAYLKQQSIVDNDPVLQFNPSFLHQSRHDMMDIMKLWTIFVTNSKGKRFYSPALRGEILGCYAQTELGHGSDIQRLQTTATYNRENQTFVINSPTVSSAKWWVGDLGMHCTHAALFAQLIIDGKRYGLHVFLVPIRDPVTFKTLSGVEAGDIGPKLGFNTKDNGYALFKNVVIPRKNMLRKFHVVSKQGKYSLQGDEKISYATMLMTRATITQVIFSQYSKIVTIATRYSLLRRQFKNKNNEQIPVLDYQTQQAKIISRIGQVYTFLFTSKNIKSLSRFVFESARSKNFDRLNEAHILTSATKAYMSMEGLNNAEVARRSAGGHGFHQYSGMIGNQHELSPQYTLQGQFTILMLQVARFLLKSLNTLQKGKPLAPSVQYQQNLKKGNLAIEVKGDNLNCPYFVHQILTNFACISAKNMAVKLTQGQKQGLSEKQFWDNYAGLTLVDAAIAHSIVTIHSFYLKESQSVKCPNLKKVLTKLCILYGLEKIIERTSRIYETGILTPQAFQLINQRREELLEELRPEALTLMDAFEYSDNVLMSAIAHSNEKPYENLINWARNYNTVNRPEERSQIIETIKTTKAQLKPAL